MSVNTRPDFKMLSMEEAQSAFAGMPNSAWRVESIHPSGRGDIEKIQHAIERLDFDPETKKLSIKIVPKPSHAGLFKDIPNYMQKTVVEVKQIDTRMIAVEFSPQSMAGRETRWMDIGIGYLQPGRTLMLVLPWERVPVGAKLEAESYTIHATPLENTGFLVTISACPKWNVFGINNIPILDDEVPTHAEAVSLIDAALKTPLADYVARFDLTAPKGSEAYYGNGSQGSR